ncbi:MAG TPA: hypothetical protein VLZ12_06345 [Verrucomicrobiae bacterium]|nr:hypothetical protein [Verrucomicrobiae bacterium]
MVVRENLGNPRRDVLAANGTQPADRGHDDRFVTVVEQWQQPQFGSGIACAANELSQERFVFRRRGLEHFQQCHNTFRRTDERQPVGEDATLGERHAFVEESRDGLLYRQSGIHVQHRGATADVVLNPATESVHNRLRGDTLQPRRQPTACVVARESILHPDAADNDACCNQQKENTNAQAEKHTSADGSEQPSVETGRPLRHKVTLQFCSAHHQTSPQKA